MSPRARRTGPAARARSASRDTARHLDQDQSTDSFPPVDASQVIATLPQVLALSDTGRIGARFAHLEHLHQWAAFEKDSNFTTAEKAALIQAVTPHMGPEDVLTDGIAGYRAAHPEVSA